MVTLELALKPVPPTVTASPTEPDEALSVIFDVIVKFKELQASPALVVAVTAYCPLAFVGTEKVAIKTPVPSQ